MGNKTLAFAFDCAMSGYFLSEIFKSAFVYQSALQTIISVTFFITATYLVFVNRKDFFA